MQQEFYPKTQESRAISVSEGERRLAAIMFTDVVGYTRLSQANESLALELLREHRDLFRPLIIAHGGTEVKTMGDAFLVEFKSALEAVTSAVEMQKKLDERNAGMVPARRLTVRVGIHLGDVIHESNDVYGDAVNIASRIEPLAEPGGICISQQVFDQIRNKTSLKVERVGDLKLKNIEFPMSVYKIRMSGNQSSNNNGSPHRERLGVLPFVNISPDPSDEYFADGLTEELIAKLSEIKKLKVIARTSMMSYKGKGKKVSEIAEELGVGSIIEGSVRKAGNKLRITVQLIDPRTEEHLWSSNYDNQLDDIFEIQSDVATKVAGSLSAGFFSGPSRKDTDDIEAYTLYLKAKQLLYDVSENSLREAVALLQRAIARDPGFARAYASLALAWHGLAGAGYEDFATMAKRAEDAAQKAVDSDPELAEAHASMSMVHSMLDRFDEALIEAKVAVRINPSLADAYVSLGNLNVSIGTLTEALAMLKKGYELDPLSFGAGELLTCVARWSGENQLAWDVLSRMKDLHPTNSKVYLLIADHHMEKKEFNEAQKMVDVARSFDPSDTMVFISQGLLFAYIGKRKEAERILDELHTKQKEAWLIADLFIPTALGNLDAAFAALNRLAETHSWPAFITCDPLYAELRKDPRYFEFSRKVGIKVKDSS